MAKLRTEYRFTLPRGTGIKVEAGRKVSGTMRLIKVKDLVDIERDSQVQRGIVKPLYYRTRVKYINQPLCNRKIGSD